MEFLNDYTTNQRGDIGSLIRVEAIQATRALQPKLSPKSPIAFKLTEHLCRLACEKLDKVRIQASLCLQDCYWDLVEFNPFHKWVASDQDTNSTELMSSRRFEHTSDTSSQEYFFQLLTSWSQEWLRLPLLKGLATSAVAGAEGLVRSSRAAIIRLFDARNAQSDPDILIEFLQVLSTALNDNLQDDRYAIPIVELMAFLIDSYYSYMFDGSNESNPIFRKVFILVQKSHFRSASITRLEAAVKVYTALFEVESLREEILKKLTSMLLHPYPRVRIKFCPTITLFPPSSSTIFFSRLNDAHTLS